MGKNLATTVITLTALVFFIAPCQTVDYGKPCEGYAQRYFVKYQYLFCLAYLVALIKNH